MVAYCLTKNNTIMKHQSFFKEYCDIAAKEIGELRRCLKAHGGSFDWAYTGIDCPIVTASIDCCEYVGDVDVKEIRLDEKGHISMIVNLHDESVCGLEIGIDDVHYSHIEFIMDYLPEPEPKDDKERMYTYREMENAIHLAADLAHDISKIEDYAEFPWLNAHERAAYFISKAVKLEERLKKKEEKEGEYEYFDELEKFDKEVMTEIIDGIPLPF